MDSSEESLAATELAMQWNGTREGRCHNAGLELAEGNMYVLLVVAGALR